MVRRFYALDTVMDMLPDSVKEYLDNCDHIDINTAGIIEELVWDGVKRFETRKVMADYVLPCKPLFEGTEAENQATESRVGANRTEK